MPRVSIGLPVHNGENYLGLAADSLLAQTFVDFELVIVDNASTDGTAEICRSLLRRDLRVRYHRNDTNIGSGPNLARAFDLSSDSEYFQWAAHDDVHEPRFLEACVDALDRNPSAILAFPRVQFIGPDGAPCGERERAVALGSPDAATRYRALLPSYDCLEIFGVIRRTALRRRPVIGFHPDGDGVLLAALALEGRFHEVPEVLFHSRRHPGQATARFARSPRAWAVDWNPRMANRMVFPAWRRIWELWRGYLRATMPLHDRIRCGRALAQWTRWRIPKLVEDVSFYLKKPAGVASDGQPR
jgi:glycosyltransferase involved in cell wall biosynthesis